MKWLSLLLLCFASSCASNQGTYRSYIISQTGHEELPIIDEDAEEEVNILD